MHAASYEAVAEVFRAEAGHLTTSLVRILGDFDLAEEIVQDTLLIALERWPVEGIPRRPGAWLHTVARRLAINRLHRDARYRDKLALLAAPSGRREPDDRLRLIFTCCHPALGREAQVALTLRAVGGLTTTEIAHALVMSEAAVAQRFVREVRRHVVIEHRARRTVLERCGLPGGGRKHLLGRLVRRRHHAGDQDHQPGVEALGDQRRHIAAERLSNDHRVRAAAERLDDDLGVLVQAGLIVLDGQIGGDGDVAVST